MARERIRESFLLGGWVEKGGGGGGGWVGGNSQAASENKNEKWFKGESERVTNINMCAQCDLRANVSVKKIAKTLKNKLASPRI